MFYFSSAWGRKNSQTNQNIAPRVTPWRTWSSWKPKQGSAIEPSEPSQALSMDFLPMGLVLPNQVFFRRLDNCSKLLLHFASFSTEGFELLLEYRGALRRHLRSNLHNTDSILVWTIIVKGRIYVPTCVFAQGAWEWIIDIEPKSLLRWVRWKGFILNLDLEMIAVYTQFLRHH